MGLRGEFWCTCKRTYVVAVAHPGVPYGFIEKQLCLVRDRLRLVSLLRGFGGTHMVGIKGTNTDTTLALPSKPLGVAVFAVIWLRQLRLSEPEVVLV